MVLAYNVFPFYAIVFPFYAAQGQLTLRKKFVSVWVSLAVC